MALKNHTELSQFTLKELIDRYKNQCFKNEYYSELNNDRLGKDYMLSRLIKEKEDCVLCGNKNNICIHHENYDFPCFVTFLCMSCHSFIHGLMKTKSLYKYIEIKELLYKRIEFNLKQNHIKDE